MKTILQTFQLVAEMEGITITKLESIIGASKGVLSKAILKEKDIQSKWLLKLVENYPDYDPSWLLTGIGEPFSQKKQYDSVEDRSETLPTSPPVKDLRAGEVSIISNPQTLIQNSEWYNEATAVYRYTGGSMHEYSNDCILFLKEVEDLNIIFWGSNYLIETTEGRIVRRLQKGDSPRNVLGVSSSEDSDVKGRIINETIIIPKKSINKLFLVLGSLKREFNP